ncbi:DUF4112 domain-containing protein [Ilumatobacter sp.]|uniref:DUF4112 domain-containing protein n=1 Tax=Ilumatobacter sp. TaxID=1967498 RepID=UPI003B516C7F
MTGDASTSSADEAPELELGAVPGERTTGRRRGETARSDAGRPVPPFVERLAWLLDDSIRVPGTDRRVGLDGAIGMVPGLGDGAGLVASTVVIVTAVHQGVSLPTVGRMVGNVLIESLVGVVPFLGDAFDFVWKSNSRNVALLRAELAEPARTRRSSIAALGISAIVVVSLLAITVAAVLLGVWLLVRAVDAVL